MYTHTLIHSSYLVHMTLKFLKHVFHLVPFFSCFLQFFIIETLALTIYFQKHERQIRTVDMSNIKGPVQELNPRYYDCESPTPNLKVKYLCASPIISTTNSLCNHFCVPQYLGTLRNASTEPCTVIGCLLARRSTCLTILQKVL